MARNNIRNLNSLVLLVFILEAALTVTMQSVKIKPRDVSSIKREDTQVSVSQGQGTRRRQGSNDEDGREREIQGFGMGINFDSGVSSHGGMTILGGPMTSRGLRLVRVGGKNVAGCRRYRPQSSSSSSTTTEALA